jgi:hypothetical protein
VEEIEAAVVEVEALVDEGRETPALEAGAGD